MNTVSIADAKNRLSELVKQVEAGEQITLTRRGHPVAHLAAAETGNIQPQAARVAEAFSALARMRANISLDGDPKAIGRQGLD